MKKLIELLNEYEKSKDFRDYEWRIEKKSKERPCWTLIMWMSWEQFTWAYIDTEEMERIIISKKYEFIKWLVENDKIDLTKLYHDMRLEFGDYYWLLMQLSISDTPIDDLISYLK